MSKIDTHAPTIPVVRPRGRSMDRELAPGGQVRRHVSIVRSMADEAEDPFLAVQLDAFADYLEREAANDPNGKLASAFFKNDQWTLTIHNTWTLEDVRLNS